MIAAVVIAAALSCIQPRDPPKGAAHATYTTDILPPARFRRLGRVTIETHDAKDIPPICDEGPPTCGFVTEACTMTSGPQPVVHLPDPCSTKYRGESWARLACHELAHALGGWPAYHGD